MTDYAISTAAYFQSLDEEYPDHIVFHINRNFQLTVFSLFKGMSRLSDIHDLNLWEFYIADNDYFLSDTVTLPKLLSMNPYHISGSELL